MRSYGNPNWIAAACVGVAALAAQPIIGQQKPATTTKPATTAKPATTTAPQQGTLTQKPSNKPPEWWSLGKTDEDDLLFMDAANLVEYENGEVYTFKGFFYYGTPRGTTNSGSGVKVSMVYETYEAWLNCTDRTLSDEKHAFYGADGKQIVIEETYEDMMKLELTPATTMEYAFVCEKERAGGRHKFQRIATDPLTYVRKK